MKININNANSQPLFSCNTCTRRLIEIAYSRSYWFRSVREPLKYVMSLWVRIKRMDMTVYTMRTESCQNCTRFYKNALKNNSAFFRLLNGWINPIFDNILERKVTGKEVEQAKKHAGAAVEGNVIPVGWNIKKNITEWLKI